MEHIWDVMERQLRAQTPPCPNISTLRDRCLDMWYNLSPVMYQKLVASVPRRVTQKRLQHQRIRQANLRVSEEPVQTQQRLQQKRISLDYPTRQAYNTLDRDLLRETNYDINILQHMVETNKPRQTEDQRTAYEAMVNFIAEGDGGILFFDIPGGT
ncbi:hypothetical protein AVEN_185943-1 [Araneus ventricosus]|uniref:Uncharacterized protein n=1 Tax=Araneus ventricosus TaxID=182803 RepID=A0A4Y2JD75_ARAVE|nr:hypothetical protein AVEN_185943-1 [Araneus ventricosus]